MNTYYMISDSTGIRVEVEVTVPDEAAALAAANGATGADDMRVMTDDERHAYVSSRISTDMDGV
jgi:hypothetical protein